jgi:hypothetical protein
MTKRYEHRLYPTVATSLMETEAEGAAAKKATAGTEKSAAKDVAEIQARETEANVAEKKASEGELAAADVTWGMQLKDAEAKKATAGTEEKSAAGILNKAQKLVDMQTEAKKAEKAAAEAVKEVNMAKKEARKLARAGMETYIPDMRKQIAAEMRVGTILPKPSRFPSPQRVSSAAYTPLPPPPPREPYTVTKTVKDTLGESVDTLGVKYY